MELHRSDQTFDTVTVDDHGDVLQRTSHEARMYSLPLARRTALEMVEIPGGLFRMGSSTHSGYPDERPQHIVMLGPFSIGKFLVTQEQWAVVMKKRLPFRFPGANRPVDNVSWDDAAEFCGQLSKITHYACHLPSEAQWEYACRAGTATPFHFGDTLTTDLANFCGDHTYLLEPIGVYRHATTEGGTFPPNAFGLYDVHGNLWEWCADAWHPDYQGAPLDGSAWEETGRRASLRVLRGGSWHEPPNHCRSAVRIGLQPGERDDVFGFRVAIEQA